MRKLTCKFTSSAASKHLMPDQTPNNTQAHPRATPRLVEPNDCGATSMPVAEKTTGRTQAAEQAFNGDCAGLIPSSSCSLGHQLYFMRVHPHELQHAVNGMLISYITPCTH